MADYFGAAESLVGGIGDFLGSQATAKGAKQAASSYATAARLSLAEANIKGAMVQRDVYKTLGGMKATVSGSGLSVAGSALDLIRDSARQGAIAKSVVDLQGKIDYTNFMAQSQAAEAQAKAAKQGGSMGIIGSVLGVVGSLFSDDALKEDVELLRRRDDGLGVYRFRYAGSNEFFEGAMASDVEKLRPDAIIYDDETGLRYVNYDAIKMEFRKWQG